MTRIEMIKGSLRPHLPHEINIDDLIKTEMALAVLERYYPYEDPDQAFLLLHNYSLVGSINGSASIAFLQKAHICLRQCSSKQKWSQLLKTYREDVPDVVRFYSVTEEFSSGKQHLKLCRNEKSTIETDRVDIYLEYIADFSEKHNTNYAKEGTYRFWIGSRDTLWAEVKIASHKTKMPTLPTSKSARPDISVTIEELLCSAKEMHQADPNDYCYNALQKNTIKAVNDNKVIPASRLTVHEVANMVGMVGAGKSTLMKVLTYHLAKQNKKIVLVLDTVADTLHMYKYFRKFGLNAAPLIGRNEREKYIYQVAESGSKFLIPEFSEYMTTSCVLSGMAQTCNTAPRYGEEPCTKLKKDKKQYTCPYLDVCPTAKMYRDIISADVVVTTVQGLAAARIPGYNVLFLEFVLEQADLVMFDECDKVQKTLDEFFTPSTDFSAFMKDNADNCAGDMRLTAEAIDGMGNNAKQYSELRLQSFAMSQRVRETIQAATGSWAKMLEKTFSAMTLYKRLCKDSEIGRHPLTPKVLEVLETAMDSPDDELDIILICAGIREYDSKFTDLLIKWLKSNDCSYDNELLHHIKLYLIVTRFDDYVRSLDEAYSFLTDEQRSAMELFDFLQARFTAQQKLLPSAAMGNLFGMKNDKQKGLQLYRQYTFGRSLMNSMPWLRLTDDGKPAGPNVLLLSGSSWANGCLEYHVNIPVKYLLEAEEWKREKLAETEMIDLAPGIRVSGAGQKDRESNLQDVIKKIIDSIEAELNSGEKILMIVNSYNDAKTAVKSLNTQLQEKSAACMVRSTDEDVINDYTKILRGEVGIFDRHPAKILVAPAQAIERGYNIVNENGHSTFGSVFFLVRPMPVPDEISSKCAKLNGIIEQRFFSDDISDPYLKAKEIRKFAATQWSVMEEQARKSLSYLNETMKCDVTASLFVLILQIFGRLARITEKNRRAPRVYFADGAFRTPDGCPNGYDCLNELRNYLEQLMENESSGEIAKTLYEPFYKAFMRGVNNNAYTDISDGFDSEDEYSF